MRFSIANTRHDTWILRHSWVCAPRRYTGSWWPVWRVWAWASTLRLSTGIERLTVIQGGFSHRRSSLKNQESLTRCIRKPPLAVSGGITHKSQAIDIVERFDFNLHFPSLKFQNSQRFWNLFQPIYKAFESFDSFLKLFSTVYSPFCDSSNRSLLSAWICSKTELVERIAEKSQSMRWPWWGRELISNAGCFF